MESTVKKPLTIKKYIESENVQDRIREVLKNKAPQFIVSLLSTVNGNEKLALCEPQSVMNAAMTAASLDLPINQNLGLAYIIPYGDKAQFQMGAKGFKQLAMRSGMYETINDTDVREGEYKGINRLTGEVNFNWLSDDERAPLKVIGYLSYFKLQSGYHKSRYMTVTELTAHATRFSKSFTSKYAKTNLWKDDFDAMARKTVIKLLLSKDGLLSTELQTAIESDQSVVDENNYKYPDNEKLSPEDRADEKERNRILNYIKEAQTVADLKKCYTSLEGDMMDDYETKLKELEEKEGGEQKND